MDDQVFESAVLNVELQFVRYISKNGPLIIKRKYVSAYIIQIHTWILTYVCENASYSNSLCHILRLRVQSLNFHQSKNPLSVPELHCAIFGDDYFSAATFHMIHKDTCLGRKACFCNTISSYRNGGRSENLGERSKGDFRAGYTRLRFKFPNIHFN